jgi:sugar transferase EpsL
MTIQTQRLLKRAMDVVVSISALVLLLPVIFACAVAIRWKMGSPVLFRQPRPGRAEQVFGLVKFRTMTQISDASGELLVDRDRLTPLGRFLRHYSLDELPTFLNVARGEMSLVGPRPLLVRYLPFFTDNERRRFDVRPGITGLAQIRGRNLVGWDERLAADVEYVESWSLRLDLCILARTLGLVLRGTGVAEDANVIMRDLDAERSSGQG